jgi:hypothetical protein
MPRTEDAAAESVSSNAYTGSYPETPMSPGRVVMNSAPAICQCVLIVYF